MKRKYGKDKSCGYLEHGSECLCDVKPIGVKIGVADLVNDMFMGRELCDVRNYCAPWTPNDILDYFTDLCTFYDAYAEQKKNPVIIGDFESQTLPEHVRHGEHGGRTQIRHYVRTVYDTHGRSMSDTLRQLGVSPDEYRYSLSVSRKSKYHLTADDIDYLERELTKAQRPPMAELRSKVNVPEVTIMAFAKEVEERRRQLHKNTMDESADMDAATTMAKNLALNTGHTPTKIVRMVYDKTGVILNISTPVKYRKRNK